MHAAELDSFIFKFKHLWRAGCDAHLDINTHAGQAWVGLHVRLGHAQRPHHQNLYTNVNKARNGFSRQRRRERRAAQRKQAEEATTNESTEVTEEVIDTNNTEKVAAEEVDTVSSRESEKAETDLIETHTAGKAAESEKEKTDLIGAEKDVETTGIDKNVQISPDEGEVEVSKTAIIDKKVIEEQIEKRADDILNEVCDTVTVTAAAHSVNIVPTVVTINATAIIDNSPNEVLTNEDISSIVKILRNKEHLASNIVNIEYSYLSTREFRQKFKHTVGLAIFVKTCNLWEGARSYIFRHIGRDTWTLRNGSEVNILRIHQK